MVWSLSQQGGQSAKHWTWTRLSKGWCNIWKGSKIKDPLKSLKFFLYGRFYRHLQTSTDYNYQNYHMRMSWTSDFTHSESMTFTAAGASATVLGRPNDEIGMMLHDIRDIRDWRCLEMSRDVWGCLEYLKKNDEKQVSKNL